MNENSSSGFYEKGKPLPDTLRKQMVHLLDQGKTHAAIARELHVNPQTVSNILHKYQETGDYTPTIRIQSGQDRKKMNMDTLKAVELYKLEKPSTYLKEIRGQLVEDDVCTNDTCPSLSYISREFKGLNYTHKKLQVVPRESQSPEIQAKYDQYLDVMTDSHMDPYSIHFFYEASVVRTTGNRKFGDAARGSRAVEVQRYASNTTLTLLIYFTALHVWIITM
jgi:transposase-like protein